MRKRSTTAGGIALLIMLALLGRITYIALANGPEYAASAALQRANIVPIKEARGVIYDRNMLALTDGQTRLHIAVFPNECEDIDAIQTRLGERIDPSRAQVFLLPEGQEDLLNLKGVMAVNISERYLKNGVLSHVIGYPPGGGNGMGIENSLNEYLKKDIPSGIATFTDARRSEISGLGVKVMGEDTLSGVCLTIDYHIQETCETALSNAAINGAAIVVDTATGEILAMASAPGFTQDDLGKYLSGQDAELMNRATSSYDVGSVFKIVVAAAALEGGYAKYDTKFSCPGKASYNGKDFACNNKDGHGALTLAQGFAYSCNVVFYELGQRIGAERITEMSKRFGLSQKILDGLIEEQSGNIPQIKNPTKGETANISIGQGDIQVTPLQIADIVCTIVNNGERLPLTLVSGLIEDDGTTVTPYPTPRESETVLSPETASILKKIMIEAVEYGTGKAITLPGGAGGKTGSAETGWQREDGSTMTHGWFAGFFPADNPRYACVVLAEDGQKGSASAAPIFSEIAQSILTLNR